MTFTVKIKTGNDAMRSREDVSEALKAAVRGYALGMTEGTVSDLNGNTVGSWKATGR